MNRLLICGVAVATFVSSSAVLAIEYRFTNVADTTTSAPSGKFTNFSAPAISGDTVAFEAYYPGGAGIFAGSGGALTTIVKSGDPGPLRPFGGGRNPAISGSNVAFYAGFGDVLQSKGIFVGNGGPLTTIAIRGDALPGGTFISPFDPVISGNVVAFRAYYWDSVGRIRAGIFTGSGGALNTVAKTGDAAPYGIISDFANPTISNGNVAFVGYYEESGIFIGNGGALRTVVKSGDAAPIGTFKSFASPSISGEAVAFIGEDDAGGGIFRVDSGGAPVTIVRVGDAAPTGMFANFREPSLSGSSVAFLGSFNDGEQQGIFIGTGGPLTTAIKTGDSLFGSSLVRFSLIQEGWTSFGLDPDGSGRLAFIYELADGRSGVAIATPVPEPAVGLALLFAANALMVRPARGDRIPIL